MNDLTIYIKNRTEKDQRIKDAIFAFSGGKKSLLIKGEGSEISTAVEIAEILKRRLYPGVVISDITLGSRPFIEKGYYRQGNRNNNRNNNK